jgi:AraC-like DNA-binding protein
MPRRLPRASTEIRFQNASASRLGRITRAAIGVRQSVAVTEPRVFGQYAIVYIVHGRGKYADAGGIRRNVGPGDVMILFPDVAHVYSPLPGTSWVTSYLCFQGPLFDLWRRHKILSQRHPVHHAEPVAEWNRRIESVVDASRQAGSTPSLLALCRLQQLLAEITSGTGQPQPYQNDLHWLDRVCGLIEANPAGAPDWNGIARQVGLSAESLRKRFRRLAGQPPARYRMARLIDRACELMQTGAMKDREIAESLGFCDEYYFSRRFKAVTGQSPRQFRRRGLRV